MTIPKWQPGHLYNTGDFVVPRSNNIVTQEQPHNNSFEDGLTHWTATFEAGSSGTVQSASDRSYDGAESAQFIHGTGTEERSSGLVVLINDFEAAVTPGKVINFQCYLNRSNANSGALVGVADGGARIYWYDSSHDFISYSAAGTYPGATSDTPTGFVGGSAPFDAWLLSSGSAVAPAGAAFAQAAIAMRTNNTGGAVWGDNYTWDYTHQGLPDGLVFVATQVGPGTSASQEPVWPLESGQTVVDGGVTWDAEFASRIIWTANPILESGDYEPTWPTVIGGHVAEAVGTPHAISWVATDGRILDVNCPHSKIVAIAQSKVFAGDDDTIPFSATTNPLDWTTPNDAGYLPFGLQTYGSEPVAALGLYRSNLVAMNSLGYQMWQIDPDPANMALLDAEPVGSTFPKSLSPVQNDLVFLTTKGIRSLGISGAAGNIQAGQFGKNLDPLVIISIKDGKTPRGLFYPGTGQYWLAFGPVVYVMTNNGGGKNSWSEYEFPADIDYWTVSNGTLFLRSGDLVWEVSEDALFDDIQDSTDPAASTSVVFEGTVQWPFLDLGPIGTDKELEGIDLVCTGTGRVNILYDQTDFTAETPDYIFDGDTLPGIGMLPFPMTAPSFSLKLTFDGGQAWEWETSNMYLAQTKNA
jgi:hypothetical protein